MSERSSTLLSHLFFAMLFVLSVVFFRERLFVDSSYYITRVICSKGFWIEHHRYVLGLSQWLPLAGLYMGFGLKTILLLYSIGHVLFFYVVFLIARYGFRDHQAGLLLAALQVIGLSYGWFTPMFELYYGCALLILLDTLLSHGKSSPVLATGIGLVSFIALMSHPFVIFLFLFLLLYRHRTKLLSKQLAAVLALPLLLVLIIKLGAPSDYEKDKTQALFDTLKQGDFGLRYVSSLLLFLLRYYWDVLLLFITGSILLIRQRRHKAVLLGLGTFVLLLVLINLLNYGFDHSRYQEQVYFPLVFLGITIFATAAGPLRWSLLLPLLILVRLGSLLNVSQQFRARTGKMEALISAARSEGGSKFYVADEVLPKGGMDPTNWSYPVEILLLSSLDGPEASITLCTADDYLQNPRKAEINDSNFLLRRYDLWNDEAVPAAYFHILHGPYKELKTLP